MQMVRDAGKVMMASSKLRQLTVLWTVLVLLVFLGAACLASSPGLLSFAPRPSPRPVGTGTDPNNAGRSAAIALPPQGLYESCLPSESDCLAHLTEMVARGFQIVLNDGLRYAASAGAKHAALAS